MKLLQRFRKKPSGEEMNAQAARELEEALSPAMAGSSDALTQPIDPAAESEAPHANGLDGDMVGAAADVAPVTELTARRRVAPRKTTGTRKNAATKAPARKVTPRKVAAVPTVAKKPRATTAAAKKPARRPAGSTQSAARKRQG